MMRLILAVLTVFTLVFSGNGMPAAAVEWQANWIWLEDSAPQLNQVVQARTVIEYGKNNPVLLHITADSRYRLYINEEWIGDGPARSFPHLQQFDTYNVDAYLKNGKNVIGIEAAHWGESTFQYISGKPGLLCQIESGSTLLSGSDADWKIRTHPGHQVRTQRIACQQAFEEQLDGRGWDTAWLTASYDDSTWNNAVVLGKVGMKPWTNLVPRDIPFLTNEPVYPVRVQSIKQVKEPNTVTGINIRYSLSDGNLTANHLQLHGALVTQINSPSQQTLTYHPTNSTGFNLFVNGTHYGWMPKWESTQIPLQKGPNLLMAVLPGSTHWSAATFAFDTPDEISLSTPIGDSGWAAARFDTTNKEIANAIQQSKTWEELAQNAAVQLSQVSTDHISPTVAYNAVWGGTPMDDQPRVEHLEHAFSDTSNMAVIHPGSGDTEVVLDFGKEIIGYFDIELDAPDGVIIDAACYEAIEDGVIHWSQGNLCSFRYTTREGWQQFLSRYRRGFRYATLVFRNVTEPVRIKTIRTILSTYPDVRKGSFTCSDPVLNKIWDVGVWTLRMCSEDTFTDCPLYEQTYWVGDGRNEALVSYPVWGVTPLVKRCTILPGQSLYRSKLTESQVPSGWQNLIPAWSFLWVQMAQEYYLYSGDKDTLALVYPDVVTLLDNCREFINDKGIFSIDAWNFFDWAGMDIGHSTCTHNNILLAETAHRAAIMAEQLGKSDDVAKWKEYQQQIIEATNRELWNADKQAYIDSIHGDGAPSAVSSRQTNSLGLLYNTVPTQQRGQLIEQVFSPQSSMVDFGSPFALFYGLELMTKEDRYEELVTTIRNRWQPMLEKGATTFWEMFPSEGGQWWTRSHCHAWSAAPTYFLSAYQLGVQPLEPGFSKLRIAPQPAGLDWCEGTYPTPQGDVFVSWKMVEDGMEITATVPGSAQAEIILPLTYNQYRSITVNGSNMQSGLPGGMYVIHDLSRKIGIGLNKDASQQQREISIEVRK